MLSMQLLVEQIRPTITELDVSAFAELINKDDSILIDIREPIEVAQGMIEGAINIPRGVLEGQLANIECVKNSPAPLESLNEKHILIYCRSGARGVLAADSLQRMGFKNVVNLIGGIIHWEKHNTIV